MNRSLPGPSSSVLYFCVHCDPSPINSWFAYDTIEKLHAHWLSNHTEFPVAKPFQFYAIEAVGCGYCPNRYGTFNFIKVHHKTTHETRPFILVRHRDPELCALCLYRGDDLVQHFQQMHTAFVSSDEIAFHPVCFTPEFLVEMLQKNVHRRFQCGRCGATFETEHEAKWHSVEKHGHSKDWSTVVQQTNAGNRILHVICGKCRGQFQPNDLLPHLMVESQPHSIFTDLMKVKVVFANGLTVVKQNLTCTTYDDTKQIMQLFPNGQ